MPALPEYYTLPSPRTQAVTTMIPRSPFILAGASSIIGRGVRLQLFTRIDIDLFSILLTIILISASRYRSDRGNAEYRLFTLLLSLTGLELAADAAISALEGTSGILCRAIALTAITVYYMGFPFAAMVYAFYAEDQVAANSRRDRSWMRFIALPAVASALLSLSTPATVCIFIWTSVTPITAGRFFRSSHPSRFLTWSSR